MFWRKSGYQKLVPMHGWSDSMSKDKLRAAFPRDSSILLHLSSIQKEREDHWKYLDAAGVTETEYLHSVSAMGMDGVHYLTFCYAYNLTRTKEFVERYLGGIRMMYGVYNSALTIILRLIDISAYDDTVGSESYENILNNAENEWEALCLIGVDKFFLFHEQGATLGEMKLMHEHDIDFDMLAQMR